MEDNTLYISKINENYIRVNAEAGILYELNEYFTFLVPGHTFMPAFRMKTWDGKIRLFSLYEKKIYLGLYKKILEFAKKREYKIVLESQELKNTNNITIEEVNNFISSLDIPDITPHDYQVNAFMHCLHNKRGVLLSPTSSGKSLIIYLITRYYQSLGKKILIIVPTTSLVEQMVGDFQSYTKVPKWSEKNCHKIYSGHEKINNSSIVVSTWQSIYKLNKNWFSSFDVLIGDECHLFSAKSLQDVTLKSENASVRIGTTGTLNGTKTHELVLTGLFGPVEKVITTKELIDKKKISDIIINCCILEYSEEERKIVKEMKYAEEIDFIVAHKTRNNFITNLALSCKGNTLVLFNLVEKHGKVLFELIKQKNKDKKLFFVSGEIPAEAREKIRSISEANNDVLIVASYGTFSTGVSIKNLHNVIFASPSKSRIRNLQSIGRALRKNSNKEVAILYDIADDISYKKHKNFTLQHFLERVKIYNEEKFRHKIYQVKL